jgi:hypothetical protein
VGPAAEGAQPLFSRGARALRSASDELQLTSLTRALDKPMRNASDNEQMFAAILHELQSSTMRQP